QHAALSVFSGFLEAGGGDLRTGPLRAQQFIECLDQRVTLDSQRLRLHNLLLVSELVKTPQYTFSLMNQLLQSLGGAADLVNLPTGLASINRHISQFSLGTLQG